MFVKIFSKRNQRIGLVLVILLFVFGFSVNVYIGCFENNICDTEICWSKLGRPAAPAAIILGARVYSDGSLSDMMQDRMNMGIQLYDNGFVKKLLISHGELDGTSLEVNSLRNYALKWGVPAEDIFTDYAGFDTYDSMWRAKNIYKIDKAIVVTQNYHLPRALYLADKVGIESFGRSADTQIYQYAFFHNLRESLARIKAWFSILINADPKFSGNEISITGNGLNSWDGK